MDLKEVVIKFIGALIFCFFLMMLLAEAIYEIEPVWPYRTSAWAWMILMAIGLTILFYNFNKK